MKVFLKKTNAKVIVLNNWWKKQLYPFIGDTEVVHNPVSKIYIEGNTPRNNNHVLLLGRKDPIKGHAFGKAVCQRVRETGRDLRVTMSGITSSQYPWLEAIGWISESEKLHLLQTTSLLIVPSKFEGEPLVVLEAISCGLSVLASDRLHSLPSSVEIAPFENEQIWVEKIIQLLEKPTASSLLKEHSKMYRIETISNKWKEIYGKLVTK